MENDSFIDDLWGFTCQTIVISIARQDNQRVLSPFCPPNSWLIPMTELFHPRQPEEAWGSGVAAAG